MQTVNKKALAQGAISLLTSFPKEMEFNMKHWFQDKNGRLRKEYQYEKVLNADKCGSSCCLLGWIGISQGVKGFRSWLDFQKSLGIPDGSRLGTFLFDTDWPSDKKQAARRVLLFLEKGIPAGWNNDFTYTCLTSLSNKQVIHRLEKFL